MANSSLPLTSTIPLSLPSGSNSFVSGWMDKRSATTVGLSIVFYGSTPPDGYAWVEVSNAITTPGAGGNLGATPINNGDDATELASSQKTITLNTITGHYDAQWQLSDLPARWVRVRYTATASVSGLTVNVYANAPHESP